jgi:hypothetical protein
MVRRLLCAFRLTALAMLRDERRDLLQEHIPDHRRDVLSTPPVLPVEWPQPGSEDLELRQKLQVGLEVELTILEGQFESVDEFAAKDFRQHFLRQEVFLSGANLAGVIRRETAGMTQWTSGCAQPSVS